MVAPRIAVFGAGLIGQRHVEQAANHASLAAIVDPSTSAQIVADQYAVPLFDAPSACLENTGPDGVVIATPNPLHEPHAVLCMEAGIPVLVEKPIADTLHAAMRIEEVSKRTGVPVLVGHHRRHNPIVTRAVEAIHSGLLGEIIAVQGQFWLYKPDDYFDAQWRTRDGGGPILINFIHDIDLLRAFCGDIAEIQAMRSNRQRGHAVEDTAAILLRFESGALGTFTLSDTIAAPWSWEMTSGENPIYPHRPGSCYRIGGTKGSLSLPDLTFWQHKGPRSWWEAIEPQTLHTEPRSEDAFTLQFKHFLDVIEGAPPKVSAAQGRASLEAVLAALEAPLVTEGEA